MEMRLESKSKRIEHLESEIIRLKKEFELQNLCHNLPGTDQDRFFEGCKKYQYKLFGTSHVDLETFKDWNAAIELAALLGKRYCCHDCHDPEKCPVFHEIMKQKAEKPTTDMDIEKMFKDQPALDPETGHD